MSLSIAQTAICPYNTTTDRSRGSSDLIYPAVTTFDPRNLRASLAVTRPDEEGANSRVKLAEAGATILHPFPHTLCDFYRIHPFLVSFH
jgi:hypothetical protein